ncbi:Uncharacterised protein [Serratia rubidaea]|nr:Uncharacterised protein [Serratia rubidaea]
MTKRIIALAGGVLLTTLLSACCFGPHGDGGPHGGGHGGPQEHYRHR